MSEQLYKQAAQAEQAAPKEALAQEITSQMRTAIEHCKPFLGERPANPVADEYSVEKYWKESGFKQVFATEPVKGSEIGLDDDKAEDLFGFVGVRSIGFIQRSALPVFGSDGEDFIYLALYPHKSSGKKKEAFYTPLSRHDLIEMSDEDLGFVKSLADLYVTAADVPNYLKPR